MSSRPGASAWLLDLLIGLAPFVAVGALLAAGADAAGGLLLILGFAWLYFIYAPVTMMRDGERNGQTWGKQALDIRVVREDGQPIGYGYGLLRELVIRNLLFGVVGGFFFFPTLLDYLWPLWDDENRSLHDMVASSRVVRA